MTETSRRTFLRRVVTPSSTVAGLALGATGISRANVVAEDRPAHVSRRYDESLLQEFKPYLVTRDLGSNTPNALFGFVARSTEFDHTMLVYWAEYDFQKGVVLGYDSHFGDHEPVYIRVDEAANEIVDISYSAYHWLRGYTPLPPVDSDTGNHPLLHVVDPWHHYYTTAEEGVDVDLTELTDETLQAWWDNGWDEAIHLRSLSVPWVMAGSDGRKDWWQDSAGGFSFEATLRRYYYPLRFGVDPNVDLDLGGRST